MGVGHRDDLPTGRLALAFTDIEGSTALVRQLGPDAFRAILERHSDLIRKAVEDCGGVVVGSEGDSFFIVFPAGAAAGAGLRAAQAALDAERWDTPLRVRMGAHAGEVHLGGTNYVGLAVHHCARVAAAAHGGQLLVTAEFLEWDKSSSPLAYGTAGATSLGRHRLKDLSHAVELFQLGEGTFPPPRTLERAAHNLPVRSSTFVGREEELARLDALLAVHSLVTLTGPGGSGKTRLAQQAAAERVEEHADGVWFVGLDSLPKGGDVAGAIGLALGVGGGIDDLQARLRNQQLLLVLDNCEHLIDEAAVATRVLNEGCPGVRVLVTSREALRIPGEVVVGLEPLEAEGAGLSLFLDRAAEASPGFRPDAQALRSISRLCTHLDGMPLAIELAAARCGTLTPDEILDRLENDPALLEKGARGGPGRHAGLSAAIAWSYELLGSEEQQVLRLLALFPSDFDLKAAEAVCATDARKRMAVAGLVESLVDKSLTAIRHQTEGPPRFDLLETIRRFVVAAGEADPGALLRFCEHYVSVAADLSSSIVDKAPSVATLRAFDTEAPHFELALETLHAEGRSMEAVKLTLSLAEWWSARGMSAASRRHAERALAVEDLEPLQRMNLALVLGATLTRLGDLAGSAEYLEEAERLARQAGNRSVEIDAGSRLAMAHFRMGDYDRARTHWEASARTADDLGEKRLALMNWIQVGGIAANRGDFESALPTFESCVSKAQDLGDSELLVNAQLGLGTVLLHLRRYEDALEPAELALAGAEEYGLPTLRSAALRRLATVVTNLGDIKRAGDLLATATELAQQLGNPSELASLKSDLGSLAETSGDPVEAVRCFEESLRIADQFQIAPAQATALRNLGRMAADSGDWPTAIRRGETMVELTRTMGPRLQMHAYLTLASGLLGLGSIPDGLSALDRAESLATEQKDAQVGSQVAALRCGALLSAGDLPGATSSCRRSLELNLEVGAPFSGLEARLEDAAEVLEASGQLSDATSVLAGLTSRNSPSGPVRVERMAALETRLREGLAPEEFDRAWRAGADSAPEEVARSFLARPRLEAQDLVHEDGGGVADVQ